MTHWHFQSGVTQEMSKIGIFIGSIISGLLGAIVLIVAYKIRSIKNK